MAEKKKLSVEEILAQARQRDGGGGAAKGGTPAETPASEPPPAAEPVPPAAAAPPAGPAGGATGKKASEMSVADVLAAARAGKAGTAPAASEPAAKPAAAPAAPAGSAAAGKKPGEMSVADILAAARGKAPAAAAPATPAPAKPTAAKPAAAKPAAAKAAAEKPAAKPGAAAAHDTASILAAARGGAKPGPMTKAEAAAKGAPAAAAATKPKLPPKPERPAYLAAPATTAAAAPSRRTFFGSFGLLLFGSSLAVGFSSLFVTNLLWVLGLARYMFPNILIEPPTVFKVGFPTDYAPGQVETKYVAQFGVWIVRYEYEGQSQIYALRTVCTHLGCTPNWLEGEQKFKCPCHGSGFYKDGVNFEGPAPRPLERYAVRLADDGQLEVDKSRKFQEELGQWQDASSFVSV